MPARPAVARFSAADIFSGKPEGDMNRLGKRKKVAYISRFDQCPDSRRQICPASHVSNSALRPQLLYESMELIRIRGARTHNLKNINLDLPRNKLIVITGLSGTGKSSLAFDTLYAE